MVSNGLLYFFNLIKMLFIYFLWLIFKFIFQFFFYIVNKYVYKFYLELLKNKRIRDFKQQSNDFEGKVKEVFILNQFLNKIIEVFSDFILKILMLFFESSFIFKNLKFFFNFFVDMYPKNTGEGDYFFDGLKFKKYVYFLENNNLSCFKFKIFNRKNNYTLKNLKFLAKQYNFFFNSKFKNNFFNIFFKFFKKRFKKFFFFFFLITQLFFFTNFYNFISSFFYFKVSEKNLIKFNFVFYAQLQKCRGFLYIFDNNKLSDWYKINFDFLNLIVFEKSKPNLKILNLRKSFKFNKFLYFAKIYKKYNKNYFSFFKKLLILNNSFYLKKFIFFKINDLYKYKFDFKFKKTNIKKSLPIRFSESSMNKYISLKNLDSYNFFFLRKNRIFNKGRYSRNRQLYRTGVYWCLWLNIIIVYGLFFLFYRFTFNFGYIWIGVFLLLFSFIISKVIKYNFVSIFEIYKEFFLFLKWVGLIFLNFLLSIKFFFKKILLSWDIFYNFNFFYGNFFFFQKFLEMYFNVNFFKKFIVFFKKLEFVQFNILWREMQEEDTSLFKYKTVLHFFKQLTQIHKMV